MTTHGRMTTHRGGECHVCEGTGATAALDDDDSDDGVESVCDACEGTGLVYWYWSPDDIGHCGVCDSLRDRPTCEWGPEDEYTWICEDCARKWHAQECGCDAWAATSSRIAEG